MSGISSCACNACVSACESKPGWFMPEQIPDLLEFFQAKNLDELLGAGMLAIDYFDGPADGPLMLSPNIVGNAGKAFPFNPLGQCVFLKDGLCDIHVIKPFECSEMLHSDDSTTVGVRHAGIAQAWRDRTELEEFRKEIPEFDIFGALDMMVDYLEKMTRIVKRGGGNAPSPESGVA